MLSSFIDIKPKIKIKLKHVSMLLLINSYPCCLRQYSRAGIKGWNLGSATVTKAIKKIHQMHQNTKITRAEIEKITAYLLKLKYEILFKM